jgi:hypothetical protein
VIPPSAPDDGRDPLWERAREFERLVRLRVADPEAPLPAKLTKGQIMSVEAESAARTWGGNFTRGEYYRAFEVAWKKTALHVQAPRSDSPTEDVVGAWLQPEGRDLWRRIMGSVHSMQRAIPALQMSLGAMLATSAMRATPHILHGWDLMLHNEGIRTLVNELAQSCDGVHRQLPRPVGYSTVTRHLPRLSHEIAAEVRVTLATIAIEYMRQGIPVGRFLAVDGSLVPAWVSPRTADARRQKADVGVRRYQRRQDGVLRTTRTSDGYHLTVLADLATGLVLAFDVANAQKAHEPLILRDRLLPSLFAMNPDLGVDAIVGDNLFDNRETHEHLETRYGIHLVAHRYRHQYAEHTKSFKPESADKQKRHPSVASIRGDGVAICRRHGLLLEYRGLYAPRSREGLTPGELVDPHGFRTRFTCPDGCGVTSVRTSMCWDNLPYYPHTPYGRLKLYAYRRALLNRRNLIESLFSALQVAYKQGLDGAARVRVADRNVQEALIALSIVTRALLALRATRDATAGFSTAA